VRLLSSSVLPVSKIEPLPERTIVVAETPPRIDTGFPVIFSVAPSPVEIAFQMPPFSCPLLSFSVVTAAANITLLPSRAWIVPSLLMPPWTSDKPPVPLP